MPTEILDVTKRFMRDPIQILVKKEELTLEGIRQFYVNVEKEEWKVRSFSNLENSFKFFISSWKHYAICMKLLPSPSVLFS